MAKRFALAVLLLAGLVLAQEPRLTPAVAAEHPILPIGSAAPDFALPGIDDQIHRLHDYDGSPILAVMFHLQSLPDVTALRRPDQETGG